MEKHFDDTENCKFIAIHNDIVEKVKETMLTEENNTIFQSFLKSLVMIQALNMGKTCVYNISVLLDTRQSAISHKLKVLRQSKLVKLRKAGKVVYYSLDDEHIKQIFNHGLQHINEK